MSKRLTDSAFAAMTEDELRALVEQEFQNRRVALVARYRKQGFSDLAIAAALLHTAGGFQKAINDATAALMGCMSGEAVH